ncbi:hypothetical protein KCTC32516_00090 [Polaribacter huanghezhanensis]|uniref:DUF349 domain-containing protein n=1 Tax=Polaribacter huanghezhanensis TaxID=1354726 RepID=UPI00264935B8|nr:DUF349 domain-containing protein [Polaribacter huanghezhanensis]WKD84756.1 hypothetical protein KCTC32516_00090 [Polaribacter huanghezhanensis]
MLDTNQENTEDQINQTPEENEVIPTETPKAEEVKEAEEKIEEEEAVEEKASTDKAVEEIEEKVAEDAEKDEERNSIPMLAYENMELEDLTNELEKLLKDFPVQQLKKNIDAIKNAFNAKFGAVLAEKKAAFLEEGGNSIDFQYSSPVKAIYNSLLSDYKKKRDAYYSNLETQLKNNLEKRHIVINELKELIENADPQTMYKNFKVIQASWREIGAVPRNKYNDTWRNYHHHVERFYDLLHLSNDFRDLDFKNNLEEKLRLIEKVEALAELENVNDAFKELQQYHKAWKEDIGPVSQEHREAVWQKFSAASKKIHDKRHDYFRSLKSQYEGIIEKKLEIVASIENYDTSKNKKHSDWQKSINDIEALRKKYFDAGKLPYSKSEEVWLKFKAATKKFNAAKNVFYKKEKSIQQDNLDKKNALIELAESYKESEDWENTTNAMKKIQADWKKVGHVPRKFSDDIWKRFKAACNHYFDRFHNRQDDLNKEQQVFIEEKKAYLDEIKKVEKATIEEINEFIQKWRELGTTPRSVRHIESKFYKQIDKLLEGLSLSKDEIAMLKYKNLIDGFMAQGDGYKLNSEQLFVRKKMDEINKEIQQLENNLSFFSNAKDDNPLLLNVRNNIDSYKDEINVWEQKLEYIKRLDY